MILNSEIGKSWRNSYSQLLRPNLSACLVVNKLLCDPNVIPSSYWEGREPFHVITIPIQCWAHVEPLVSVNPNSRNSFSIVCFISTLGKRDDIPPIICFITVYVKIKLYLEFFPNVRQYGEEIVPGKIPLTLFKIWQDYIAKVMTLDA